MFVAPMLDLCTILLTLSVFVAPASAQLPEPWWDFVRDNFDIIDGVGPLQMCIKREGVPPNDEQACGPKQKTCYFGLQQCPGIGDFPTTRCHCDGRYATQEWSCGPAACPDIVPTAPPSKGPTGTCCRASANNDPHFRGWQGTNFDYHAGCDIVLIKNAALDLDLHIRTAQQLGGAWTWAKIESAALRIGSDVLEMQEDGSYYFNGGTLLSGPVITAIGGYPIIHSTTLIAGGLLVKTSIKVQLNGSQYIDLYTYNGGIQFRIYGCDDFANSVGFLGTFCDEPEDYLGRDQATSYQADFFNVVFSTSLFLHAPDTYGQQWEVDNTALGDPLLFQSSTTNTCVSRRRLQETPPSDEDVAAAAKVCEVIKNPFYTDSCIFDIAASGDERWALNPAYSEFVLANGTVVSEDIPESVAPSTSDPPDSQPPSVGPASLPPVAET